MNAVEMKVKLQDIKNEAQAFLQDDKVKEAEAKTLEVKILNAQIEIQEKLDEANVKIDDFTNQISKKEEEMVVLSSSLDASNIAKEDLMNKYTEAIDNVTTLNEKVGAMQPIVDNHIKKEYEEKLNLAKEDYKAKFEKVSGLDNFESDEVQDLVVKTINEDNSIAIKAKYDLSEKIMSLFETQDSAIIKVSDIQEPAVENKNLNPESSDFESVYGFKNTKQ